MQRFLSIQKYVLIAVITFVLVFFTLLIIDCRNHPGEIRSVLGYIPMTVVSGSMSPQLETGDLIIVKKIKPEKIKNEDIISFSNEDNLTITHRVIEITRESNGLLKILTKGDANDEADNCEINKKNLIGVLNLRIPFGGYFVKFMASWRGFAIILVIPIFIAISGELREILSDESKKQKTLNLESGRK